MTRARGAIAARINRWTLLLFAAAGIVAAVAGTLTEVPWIKQNLAAILLFELSSLLGYLVVEFGYIREGLEHSRSRDVEVRTIDDPDRLYQAAANVMRESMESTPNNKSILVVSATGVPNARPSNTKLSSATRDYYRALTSTLGRPGWSVRIIYNIESFDRLNWIHDFLGKQKEAVDLEAKALVDIRRDMLAPLIVGDNDVFLAQGDRRFHAVRAGIWLKDQSANRFSRNYFESLWQTPGILFLRRATGIDENAFMEIRKHLSGQAPESSHT
jgi:hypothetical protein